MQHQESDVKIYVTKDYERFRMINGNRGLNLKKIDRIVKDINEGNNMLKYKPVEVIESGNFLDILDGQHRFVISKKLKAEVSYVIVAETKSMNEIAAVNSNVDKWKYADFINCYINKGLEDYSRLNDFILQYKVSIGFSIKLLSNGNPTYGGQKESDLIQDFCKGKFKIKYWQEAVDTVENARLFAAFENWRERAFMVAIFRINKAGKVPLQDIVTAVNKNPEKLGHEASAMKYILKLEEILNLGKQNRRIII